MSTQTNVDGQQMANKKNGRYPRTDARYWRSKLMKPVNGRGQVSPFYSARIAYAGRRERFPLETGNKEEGADLARKIFTTVKDRGWDEALANFKKKTEKHAGTVGAYIALVEKHAKLGARTRVSYAKCFRCIVAGTMGIDAGNRFDARGGGRERWLEKVDAVRLDQLTPAKITAWQKAQVEAAGKSPAAIARRKTTVNSKIRNARALFSKKILAAPDFVESIELPKLLPFDGVTPEAKDSTNKKFESTGIDLEAIISAARDELEGAPADAPPAERTSKVEAWKVLLLAFFGALRRKEIDTLLWDQIDFYRASDHDQGDRLLFAKDR